MKKWWWVGYPVVVVLVIIISSQYLFFDQETWSSLMTDKQKVADQQAQIADLKKKLGVLSAVDSQAETENLKLLLKAQPPRKSIWYLLSEVKIAASDSGVAIVGYKGGSGGVKEATDGATLQTQGGDVNLTLTVDISADHLDQMRKFIADLENKLPLARMNKIDLMGGKGSVELESAWWPWVKVADSGTPLPDYRAETEKVKAELADYENLPEVAAATESGGVTNPF